MVGSILPKQLYRPFYYFHVLLDDTFYLNFYIFHTIFSKLAQEASLVFDVIICQEIENRYVSYQTTFKVEKIEYLL